jgi:small-conductance mechanosensitive channel
MERIIPTFVAGWQNLLPFVQVLVVSVILFLVLNFLLEVLKRKLIKASSSARHKNMIEGLARFIRYALIFLLAAFTILSVSNSLKELGITFGILSAAIGFALQGPITGVAAWVMVIMKRPFEVGDRITIGDVKGNVNEISMSHIYLEEVGRYGGEEISGRTIILPNSKLFSENIINYSLENELILGQVLFTVTYESDLDEANRLAMLAVTKYTDHFNKQAKREPHIRLQFTLNGMEVHARYFVPFNIAQIIATKITHELFGYIKSATTVQLSYQQHSIHAAGGKTPLRRG